MKNAMRFISILLLIFLLNGLGTGPASAQDPPPPPPDHGLTGNQQGGGAPVGGGLFILIALGAGYGARKWYGRHKRELAE